MTQEHSSKKFLSGNSIAVLFILSVCLAIFAGCSKDDDIAGASSAASGVIMPLKVGNQWINRFVPDDGSGNATRLDTVTVTKDTLIENERWYYVNGKYVTNRSNGLWARRGNDIWLALKYPANSGDSFVRSGENVSVVSTSAGVALPEGQYSCFQYKSRTYGSSSIYYAPNVGQVRIDSVYFTGNSSDQLHLGHIELVSAVLN